MSHKYRVNLTFIFHRSLCNERRAGTCTCTIARSSHWPDVEVSSLTRHSSHQLTQVFKSPGQPGVQVSSATTRSSLCTRVTVIDSARSNRTINSESHECRIIAAQVCKRDSFGLNVLPAFPHLSLLEERRSIRFLRVPIFLHSWHSAVGY